MSPSIESMSTLSRNGSISLLQADSSTQNVDPEPVFEFSVDPMLLRNGLRNLGNTCFLNSALQMLFSLENGFIEDLLHPCGRVQDSETNLKTIEYSKIKNEEEHIQEQKLSDACSLNGLKVAKNDELGEESRALFSLCGEFAFTLDMIELCWTTDGVEAELTQEEVEENAKKLHDALVQIGSQLIDSETCTHEIDPTPIKHAIDAKTRQFAGYRQHDSHEFFTTMLDILSDEEKESSNELQENEVTRWNPALGKKEEEKKMSVVDQHFCSRIKVTLTCSCCGYSRSRIEMFRHISLDIDPHSTTSIEECLRTYFQPEERNIKCERCDSESALETREFVKLPNALLIHLKRFIVDLAPNFMLRYRKINERVEFKEELDLDPYYEKEKQEIFFGCTNFICANPFEDDNDNVSDDCNDEYSYRDHITSYKLKSVIHHLGKTANRGHYTADVLTRNKGLEVWMRCSDSVVTPCVDCDNVILGPKSQKEAYMIMYEKVRG